ncbi:MAG: hypothetical protein ACKOWK_06505 [Micrococcales bacterium]
MSSPLGIPTLLSLATGMLYQVSGAVVDWECPSKTAFDRDLQKLIHDLEEADKYITLVALAELAAVVAA